MEIKAKAKFIRTSPKKIRLVAGLVRGINADEALTRLKFANKAAALLVEKLLKSAISNAEENYRLDKNNLFVKEITVDGGPTLKRWIPRAFGRATPIRKRTSHISIVLSERVPTDISTIEPKKKTDDDIIKVGVADEIKGEKEETKTVKQSKGVKGVQKGFANKIFNRKSGER